MEFNLEVLEQLDPSAKNGMQRAIGDSDRKRNGPHPVREPAEYVHSARIRLKLHQSGKIDGHTVGVESLEVLGRELHLWLPQCALFRIAVDPEVDSLRDARFPRTNLRGSP